MSKCHSSARCDEQQSVKIADISYQATVHNIHEVQGTLTLFGFMKQGDRRVPLRLLPGSIIWEEYSGSGLESSKGKPEDEEEQYKPTAADQALAASMIAAEVVYKIQQAHVDGEMDLATYNKLFEVARRAQIAAETLNRRLEQERK